MTIPETHNPFAAALVRLHAAMIVGLGSMTDSGPALAAKVARSAVAACNDGMAEALRSAGCSLRAAGVLVPSRPQVAFTVTGHGVARSVPLGDILLLSRQRHAGRLVGQTAMLLHIVKNARVPCQVQDVSHRYFLGHWPPFRYIRTGSPLEGCMRHVEGPHLHLGSRLLCLIGTADADMPCACQFPQGMPVHCQKSVLAQPVDPQPLGYTCFAHEVLHFVMGNAGRGVREPAVGDIGFDRVVADLLAATTRQAHKAEFGCRVVGSRAVAEDIGLGGQAAWLDCDQPGPAFADAWPLATVGDAISLVVFDMDQH